MFERLRLGLRLLAGVAVVLLLGPPARADSPSPRGLRGFKVGGFADALFVSTRHNLRESADSHYSFAWPAVLLGARAGYYPWRWAGAELEGAFGFGWLGKNTYPGRRGSDEFGPPLFLTARGHLVAQLPHARIVPFVLAGAGVLHANSIQMGKDTDLLLDAGVGAKFLVTRRITPRLDLRLDITQREGGGLAQGVALSSEALLGLDVSFD